MTEIGPGCVGLEENGEIETGAAWDIGKASPARTSEGIRPSSEW